VSRPDSPPLVPPEAAAAPHDRGGQVEGVAVWAGITALLALRVWPAWVAALLPSLWINLPLISLVVRREPLTAWGIRRPDGMETAGHLLLFLALIMPASLATLSGVGAIHIVWDGTSSHLAAALVHQLLWVALPEELFFRGYLWRRLADPRRGRLVTIAANGCLFAATHALIHPGAWAIATFLPGCYFAWLRCRTNNLTTPILTHALANTLLFAATGRL